MTKRDFEAIAAIVNRGIALTESPGDLDSEARLELVAEWLADYFTTANPAFDRARFLRACGVSECAGAHGSRSLTGART